MTPAAEAKKAKREAAGDAAPAEALVPAEDLRPRLRRLGAAALVFVLVFYVLVATGADPGLTWDESIYMGYAVRYWDWFQGGPDIHGRFDPQTLRQVWHAGQAHPPLGKLMIMLPLMSLYGHLDPIFAARLAPITCFALACALLFLFMHRRFGLAPAVIAVLLLGGMPRLFADAHFASLEMPLLLMSVATVFAFEKGIASRRWSVATGVLFGLAMLTKFNAAFLPIILLTWGIMFHGKRVLPNVIAMVVIAPVVFYLGWPAMWLQPFATTAAFLQGQFHRMALPVQYFGRIYASSATPWQYPFVMTLVTTPLLVLASAGLGVARLFSRRPAEDDAALPEHARQAGFLLLIAFAGVVCLGALPQAPKYDGIRLFLNAFPFLAGLAGIGLAAAWRRLFTAAKSQRLRTGFVAALVVLGGAQLFSLVFFHPFQLSYYNEGVGGPWGARRMGMEITYWGDTFTDRAVDRVCALLPGGGKVALVAVGSRVWPWLVASGRVPNNINDNPRDDINVVDLTDRDWDVAVVVPRWGWIFGMLSKEEQTEVRKLLGRRAEWAEYLSPVGEIPVCVVYTRPGFGRVARPAPPVR